MWGFLGTSLARDLVTLYVTDMVIGHMVGLNTCSMELDDCGLIQKKKVQIPCLSD